MSHTPENLLDRSLLRQLSGDKAFARGEEYFAQGMVRHLHFGADRVTARVTGSRTYRVKLWKGRGELQYSCSCPAGSEDEFCKHCVAVGLAWIAGPDQAGETAAGSEAEPKKTPGGRSAEDDRVREQLHEHLHSVSRERLIQLVLEATDYDDILRRRLQLETAGVSRPEATKRTHARLDKPDLEAYRRLLREAIETPDYVDYEAMPDYAQGVQEAIGPLATLLRDGYAAAVIDLCEFALVELDKINELLDGGDGSLNPVYDDLQRLHLEACAAARPDPEELAARLLDYELEGGLGVFNNAAKAYADMLGPRGLATWKRLLVREWMGLPVVQPAAEAGAATMAREPIDHRRFQLQALMERLAESEGDLKGLVAIRQRDLSSAHDFLALAELLHTAGRQEEAVACAEQGVRAFPAADDAAGLRDFLIAGYQRAGRAEDALGMLWKEFVRSGEAELYHRLKQHVLQDHKTAGDWPQWRERAFAQLRERTARDKDFARQRGRTHPPDDSVLVEILIEEGGYDEAWQEAVAGGCRADLWLQLAAKREKKHPADALRVYQSRLEPTITLGGQTAYREAIDLLDKIRGLLERLGRIEDFGPYRAEIRATHRQKRNFLKLLDASER